MKTYLEFLEEEKKIHENYDMGFLTHNEFYMQLIALCMEQVIK